MFNCLSVAIGFQFLHDGVVGGGMVGMHHSPTNERQTVLQTLSAIRWWGNGAFRPFPHQRVADIPYNPVCHSLVGERCIPTIPPPASGRHSLQPCLPLVGGGTVHSDHSPTNEWQTVLTTLSATHWWGNGRNAPFPHQLVADRVVRTVCHSYRMVRGILISLFHCPKIHFIG